MDNADRIPGLKYPTNIPKSVPIEIHQIIRNIYDNLFFNRKNIESIAAQLGSTVSGLQELIQQSVVQAITNSTTNITNAGIVSHVSTHAVRLVTYSSAADPIGSLFFETDRGALYYITDAFGVPRWQFAAGSMIGPLGIRPTDLGVADQGFMFTAIEDHLHSEYVWSGSGWITVGGQFGPPGMDGIDGEDGLPGPPGIDGIIGRDGAAGLPGPPGLDGNDGDDGVPGQMGSPGSPGANGAPGIPGSPGMDGLDGQDGQDGIPGNQGPQGIQGIQGIQGMQGISGPPGLDADPPEDPVYIQGPPGPAGSGGAGNTGTTTIDFGAFPGSSDASVNITGQAGIVAGSIVQAWIRPVATADHTDTEHMVETLMIFAGNIIAGTGFTIYGFNTSQLNEPVLPPVHEESVFAFATTAAAQLVGVKVASPGLGSTGGGGRGTRIYGQFTVAWRWS